MRFGGIPDTHGLLRSLTQSAADLGLPIDITLSTHQRWRLHALRFTLETGATLGNRIARIEIRAGTTRLATIPCLATQTALQTRQYNFTPANHDRTAYVGTELETPLPPYLLLTPGQTLRITSTVLRADDFFSNANLHLEEWIDG